MVNWVAVLDRAQALGQVSRKGDIILPTPLLRDQHSHAEVVRDLRVWLQGRPGAVVPRKNLSNGAIADMVHENPATQDYVACEVKPWPCNQAELLHGVGQVMRYLAAPEVTRAILVSSIFNCMWLVPIVESCPYLGLLAWDDKDGFHWLVTPKKRPLAPRL